MSTNAAKLSLSCEESGRADFGAVLCWDALADKSDVTLNTLEPLGIVHEAGEQGAGHAEVPEIAYVYQ